MRAEAFGEIGLLPKHFYKLRIDEYGLIRKGFFNRRTYEQRVIRRMVQLVISPWIKNVPSADQLWPLEGDKEMKKMISERSTDESLRILNQLKTENIVYYKKNGRIYSKKL